MLTLSFPSLLLAYFHTWWSFVDLHLVIIDAHSNLIVKHLQMNWELYWQFELLYQWTTIHGDMSVILLLYWSVTHVLKTTYLFSFGLLNFPGQSPTTYQGVNVVSSILLSGKRGWEFTVSVWYLPDNITIALVTLWSRDVWIAQQLDVASIQLQVTAASPLLSLDSLTLANAMVLDNCRIRIRPLNYVHSWT
jgi:hypothetical protein